MITYYEEIALTAHRSGKCTVCGKRRRRQERIYETVNPWNRNEDGSPKNRKEVFASVFNKVEAWEAKPLVCASCVQEAP